jgi:hypothetical protein
MINQQLQLQLPIETEGILLRNLTNDERLTGERSRRYVVLRANTNTTNGYAQKLDKNKTRPSNFNLDNH